MRVIQATTRGMCFGVRDALDTALRREDAEEITIWGELVHNETVLAELRAQGYQMTPETGRETLPEGQKVLITAHGVSDRDRRRLESAGKELIDTTCPLVRRVHAAARRLDGEGFHVVVLGKPGHVEVRGIVGDLGDHTVVGSHAEVRAWPHEKIGVIAQSTFQSSVAKVIVREIRKQNPWTEVRFVDTICDPTRQRIQALEELLPRVDAVVVVGGANSNNTLQLVRLCQDCGVRVVHVQGPADLDPTFFESCSVVGLTAGTSTLDWTIAQVHHALRGMNEPAGAPASAGLRGLRSP